MSIQRNSIANMAVLDETPLVVRLLRSEITPDQNQVRKQRDMGKVRGIAMTMRVRQLQPILVIETTSGYQIVVGEGRWLAAGINEEELGIPQYLDCIIVDETTIGSIRTMQIVENLQREDMSQLDVAMGFQELIDIGVCKNAAEVAKQVGVSEATVSVYMSVLKKAPDEVKEMVRTGQAKMDAAKDITALAEIDPEAAKQVIADAKEKGKLERSVTRTALKVGREKTGKSNDVSTPQTSIATVLEKSDTTPGNVEVKGSEKSKAIISQETATTEPLPANAIRVFVAMKDSSKDFWKFGARVNDEGTATIAHDLVHSNIEMAWVRFGNKANSVGEFSCSDLIVQGVIAI